MRKPPTISDIFDLAHQIGIPLPERLRQSRDWSSALHELSHWAVKPEGYLQRYLDQVNPYGTFLPLNSIPDAEVVMLLAQKPTVRWADGYERQLQVDHVSVYELDPTPNEFGARAWGLQILERMGWPNPMDCPELQTELTQEFGDPQFDASTLSGDPHPISAYGPDQLQFMGIDVAQGILRPQVAVDFEGRWIRVYRDGAIVWELDIFEGGDVVQWEALATPMRFITLGEILSFCGDL